MAVVKITAVANDWVDGFMGEMVSHELRVAFCDRVWLRVVSEYESPGAWLRDEEAESVSMLIDYFKEKT